MALDVLLAPTSSGLQDKRASGSEVGAFRNTGVIWVAVKIMVPFWVLNIIRHLVFRGPKRGT